MITFSNEHGVFIVLNPAAIEDIMQGYCPNCGEHMELTNVEVINLPVFFCEHCEKEHCEAFHMVPAGAGNPN